METGIIHLHSTLRWLVVVFLTIAIIRSFSGWFGKKEYNKADNLIALLLLSFTHLQLVFGVVLFFVSNVISGALADMGATMKNSELRFWLTEHTVIMILAISFITLGRIMSKKAADSRLKHKKGAIFYTLAMFLIFWAGILKPFLLSRGLF